MDPKSLPSNNPSVTEAMINEYLKHKLDPEWYFSFVGKTAATEPVFWDWAEHTISSAILEIAARTPEAFAHPLLGLHLRDLARNFLIAGYFMGMRKYETSLESMFQLTYPVMPNERPKSRRKKKPKPGDDVTGASEITPDDLAP